MKDTKHIHTAVPGLARNLVMGIAAFTMMSCTANYLDINSDPYAIGDAEMQRDGYAIRSSLVGLANGVISPDLNTTQFTENLLGSAMGGYMADGKHWGNTISKFNPTDNWTNVFMKSPEVIPVIYTNYNKLHEVTDDPVILAVGDIIKVAAMHRVTDTYGPIPYSLIGKNGELKCAYDSQEQIYTKMLEELTAAVDVLTSNVTNNFAPTADVIYGGKVINWIKFANSLKLRLAMRISYAKPELSKQMAEEAVKHEVGVMTSNEDNATFATFGTDGNPIKATAEYNIFPGDGDNVCTNRMGDSGAAADIICYMNGYNDPRRPMYFTPSEFEGFEYVGMRRSIITPDKKYGHKFCGVNIPDKNAPVYWMNAAEVAFLKAEAVAVFGYDMGGDAKTFYEEGIRLSFEQYGVQGADAYMADATSVPQQYIDPLDKNSYDSTISTITIAWDEAATPEVKQERIITQKWIANWLLGNEAWADYRRTGYPHLMPAVDNLSGGIVDSNLGARRMPYPADEAASNGVNYAAAVADLLKGADNMATRLWFDCKK